MRYFPIFILVSLFACTQKQTFQCNNFNQIKDYLKITNKAELQLIDSSYAEALGNYESAFEVLNSPYATDLFNASVAAFKLAKEDKGLSLLESLFRKGVKLENLVETNYYAKVNASNIKLWTSISNAYHAVLQEKSYPSFDKAKKETLDSLQHMDQLFRCDGGCYDQFGDTISAIDESNIYFLANMSKNHFPSECTVGTEWVSGTLPFYIVIFHSLQRKEQLFKPILDSALINGNIHPYQYAVLVDEGADKLYGKYGSVAYYDMNDQIVKEFSASDERQLNKNRLAIGLSPIDEYYKKVAYEMEGSKDFELNTMRSLSFKSMLGPPPSAQ